MITERDGQREAFLAALRLFANLYPAQVVAHIGAGTEGDTKIYDAIASPKRLLVEGHPERFSTLTSSFQCDENTRICNAVISDVDGATDFHIASLSAESGLIEPGQLQKLWQNVTTEEVKKLQAYTYDSFIQTVADYRQQSNAPNWLIIDCFPSALILKGAKQSLQNGVEVVVVRCINTSTSAKESYLADCTDKEVVSFMHNAGFKTLKSYLGSHPSLKYILFAKDWKQWASQERTLSMKLELAQQDLAALRSSHRNLSENNAKLTELLDKLNCELAILLDSKTQKKKPTSTKTPPTSKSSTKNVS